MKNTIKIILTTPFLLLTFILFILSVKYSPVYIFRLITQNVADVYDFQRNEGQKDKWFLKNKPVHIVNLVPGSLFNMFFICM